VWRSTGGSIPVYIVSGLIVIVLMAAGGAASTAAPHRRASTDQEAATPAPGDGPGPDASFPVPPLDLPHYHGVGQKR
jgi:NADH-quinone oxidoreductase subunit H